MANLTASSSVSVSVKLTIYPAYTEAFLAALKPTMEALIAEPLNTFFEVYKLDKEPGVFKLAENWDATAEYLNDVQLKKDYYKPYYASITPMLMKPIEVEVFDRIGGEWVRFRKSSYPGRGEIEK